MAPRNNLNEWNRGVETNYSERKVNQVEMAEELFRHCPGLICFLWKLTKTPIYQKSTLTNNDKKLSITPNIIYFI